MHIRRMTPADIDLGMRLKAQAGWNQTEADWRRYLRLQPDGCFIVEIDGVGVGTTACFVFGPVAWIAVVLVDEAMRGRGIGTALMRQALAFLDHLGIPSVRLDATPLGRPIYEKLGFSADGEIARYEGTMPAAADTIAHVEKIASADLDVICALDDQISGADRRRLLSHLYEEGPDAFCVYRGRGAIEGFAASRPGANARQIGPCSATTPEAGAALLSEMRRRFAGQRVFIDVPLTNAASVQAVEAMGLKVQRHLLRMTRGAAVAERRDLLWASSGPEKG
jgi:GNAT superfamily N-acetyltransferase